MLEDLSVKIRQGCLGCYDLSVCLQIEDLYGMFGMLYIFEKNVTPPRQNKKVYLSNRRFVIKMSRFDTHISSHPRFCIHFIQILTSLYKTSPYIPTGCTGDVRRFVWDVMICIKCMQNRRFVSDRCLKCIISNAFLFCQRTFGANL